MHDSTSAGPQRPRVRRGLGVLVGAALVVTPFAAAPAASAQGLSNVTPSALSATIAQLAAVLQNIAAGLAGQTLPHPIGEKAPNATVTCTPGYADGISSTLTCVIAALDGGSKSKATVKGTATRKMRTTRWVTR
jgi:hypothetical protein